ncbi:hypothetical protein [Eubacterium limosum]|uniref:hypothetical protein n=1 Tax=Eubacterium limosum TaxID=1736 RepID=UPI003714DBA9
MFLKNTLTCILALLIGLLLAQLIRSTIETFFRGSSYKKPKQYPIKKLFPDPIISDFILCEVNKRAEIFKASTEELISKEDIQHITKVNLENKGIRSIKGLEKLTNCREWNLAHNNITKIPFFIKLPKKLTIIDLSYNQINGHVRKFSGVMLDLSFNPGNQKHNPVFYSRTMIEDLMKQIGISVSNQDRIWYLYFFNAARLITEEKPCFSELGFYKNSNNCLEIKGKEIKAYPSRFYRDDYERFKSILAGIHQNYQVLKNNKDDPFSSMPENAYINNLTIYHYFVSHSHMLGIKIDEVSHENKNFCKNKNIVTEKNNTIPKVYKPSKNYTTLQEKIFSINALLAEKDPFDPIISLLRAIGDSTEKIDRFIFDHPESKDSLRRYSIYYLPMLSDILDKYIDSTEYKGESRQLKDEVHSALEDTNTAFKKILENLSQNMEIEASCDITAYKAILEMDGVNKEAFTVIQV